MAVTLSRLGVTLDLTDRMVWTNEFAWHPVGQVHDRGTLGDLMVHHRALNAGREIDLDGFIGPVWLLRPATLQFYAWSCIAGAQLELLIRGATRTVMFDHTRKPAFEAVDIWGNKLLDSEHTTNPDVLYKCRAKFIEV